MAASGRRVGAIAGNTSLSHKSINGWQRIPTLSPAGGRRRALAFSLEPAADAIRQLVAFGRSGSVRVCGEAGESRRETWGSCGMRTGAGKGPY